MTSTTCTSCPPAWSREGFSAIQRIRIVISSEKMMEQLPEEAAQLQTSALHEGNLSCRKESEESVASRVTMAVGPFLTSHSDQPTIPTHTHMYTHI